MKEKKSLGYYAGTAVGVIITGCFMSIIIATTVKIIMWIL